MTYEDKVHSFGLRWLMNNSATVARLREFDSSRTITLETSADGSGCSCDYDYWVEYHLVVPHINGGFFKVEIEGMQFADILRSVTEAEPVELTEVAEYVMEGQAQIIERLTGELKETKLELNAERRNHTVLKDGLKSQTALWTFLRNLYKDLTDRKLNTPDALDDEDMLELCEHLYRELDLWFNEAIDGKATFALKVRREVI